LENVVANLRETTRSTKLFAIVGLIGLAKMVFADENGSVSCPAFEEDTVSFYVQTTDTNAPFAVTIPRLFLDPQFQPEIGSLQDSILIDADTRGFRPRLSDQQEFDLNVLVTDYIDLSDLANSRAQLHSGESLATQIEYETIRSSMGLQQLVFVAGQTGYAKSDIFIAAQEYRTDDPNGITDVIVCLVEGERPVAMCEHYIDLPLADMKLSYRLSHLEDWAVLSAHARTFWNCATNF
jgi:hypothetical protein